LPGVDAAALNWNPPFYGGGPRNPFTIVGQPDPEPGKEPISQQQVVSTDYFQATGIGLQRGRLFDGRDIRGSQRVVIIDDHFAQRYFPGQDPVGREISDPPSSGERRHWTIVGVVSTARHDSMGDAPEFPQTYYPISQLPSSSAAILLRCDVSPESLIEPLRKAVLEVDPQQPVTEVTTMEKVLADKLTTRRLSTMIVTTLSGTALLLASVGLYAILSHTVARRKRELGIRMAMGAKTSDILMFVLYRALRLVGIGAAVGFGCALWATHLIQSELYSVTSTDALSLAAVALALVLASLLACWLPAQRALKLDPLQALREE